MKDTTDTTSALHSEAIWAIYGALISAAAAGDGAAAASFAAALVNLYSLSAPSD